MHGEKDFKEGDVGRLNFLLLLLNAMIWRDLRRACACVLEASTSNSLSQRHF